MTIRIKTEREIAAMRESGKMLATILGDLQRATKPDVSPKDMAHLASQRLQELGGEPAFKGYQGYPDVICISVNNQVQHSIPTKRPLREGDVVNYDFGVRYRGMITDGGLTIGVGKINQEAEKLISGTKKALEAGLGVVKDGCQVGDISAAIESVLRGYKLGIVRELVGHGVGHQLHEAPEIPNYGKAGTGPTLKVGMTIAIEPIATLGNPALVSDSDGWTLWTADSSWAAQFEHTVLVTETGHEILTSL